ncbi:hypothetical protein FRC17_002265, partial [Serendipita sp. 399]
MNPHGAMYAPQQMPPAAFYSAQNKGTLQPGQVIQIQSITVTVERFLSQGGFAHVYLVRSAAPVNGTIHHVLKRMLVADHVMLQDVKKEVDIMRVLKGHTNIVTLIDSAWNPLPDGRFEVFILMEFCAGGGIIDMMNRRLRERLTEGEILQIFVDVCEGVAVMHNLKPPLLHRDLKVENILQANESSYKLCDFGSASTVSKPPTTVAEMRALEHDLNRHTTLQYRAPEMVDPHLRRPIDEKSDVWALGVLLYKLCYYTTPFEEHGPLAILNVQYRIPPYPVYSPNMISLITSILREYGTQRPSVFEILDTVHRMRGTKEAPAVLGSSTRPAHQKLSSQEWIPGKRAKDDTKSPWDGLGSLNSSEKASANGFGDSFDPTLMAAKRNLQNVPNPQMPAPASSSSSSNNTPMHNPPVGPSQAGNVQQSRFTMPTPSRLLQAPRPPLQTKPRDSYEEPMAPSTSAPSTSMMRPPSNASTNNGLVSAFSRPSTAADSVASTGTGLSSTAVVEGSVAISAAERFPSIEHLEMMGRSVPAPPVGPRAPSPVKPSYSHQHRPPAYAGLSRMGITGSFALDHDLLTSPPAVPISGVRSQQVTGTAMKGAPALGPTAIPSSAAPMPNISQLPSILSRFPQTERPPSRFLTADRPTAPGRKPLLTRRKQGSLEVKMDNPSQQKQQPEQDLMGQHLQPNTQPLMTQRTPSPSAVPQRDWLMEDDVILNTIPKAATGTIPPRLPTPDTGFTDPNKVKRMTMGSVLISNGRGIGPAVLSNARISPESPLAPWQRGMNNAPTQSFQPPQPAQVSKPPGVALPGLAKPTEEARPPMHRRRSNTTSRVPGADPVPPHLPPRQGMARASSPQSKPTPLPSLTDNWIDLWSTAGSNKSNQEVAARTNHQKVHSRDLMSFSDASSTHSNTRNAYELATHRFPSIDALERRPSPSSASGSEKDTDAPRPNLPQKRHSGSRGRPAHQLLDRNRPQSLFIPAAPGPSHPLGARHSPPESLSVPNDPGSANAMNRQASPRRGSISDMVSRYEALSVVSSVSGYAGSTESGPASPKPKPMVATKPASLRSGNVPPSAFSSPVTHRFPMLKSPVASLASASSGGGGGPVFPAMESSNMQHAQKEAKMNAPVKIRTSPLLFKSMDSPTDSGPPSQSTYARERDSPIDSRGSGVVSGGGGGYGGGSSQVSGLQLPHSIERDHRSSPGSQSGAISDTNEDILLVSPRPRQ